MKKLIIATLLLITATVSAQETEVKIKGTIEIDGHSFDNNKSKDPILFKATLDGIKIFDSKKEYQKRKCNIDSCKTIHLETKLNGNLLINEWITKNTKSNEISVNTFTNSRLWNYKSRV